MQSPYYLGLMAGTSFDGIDAALIDKHNTLVARYYKAYDKKIKSDIKHLITHPHSLYEFGALDTALGVLFAETANALIKKSAVQKKNIIAIGSHGQTIYHAPKRYSLQIAHPAIICEKTRITVVSNFRMSDIAAGGEGAPLTPYYHQHLLATQDGIIINLGGIANVTIKKNNILIGFDAGPANTLLDAWIKNHKGLDFDKNGSWAALGRVNKTLLDILLNDTYFKKEPPKSTGFEYFNLTWLNHYLRKHLVCESPENIQATLLELSARTSSNFLPSDLPVYLCGGGVHNTKLVTRIKVLLKQKSKNRLIATTSKIGIPPDDVEACAFAFFAKQTLKHKTSNLPNTTGARNARILGAIYPCGPLFPIQK